MIDRGDHDYRDLEELPPSDPVAQTWALYEREGLTERVRRECRRVRERERGRIDRH